MTAPQTQIVLAPMAGITDLPFRMICRAHGADAATSEMVSSNPALRKTSKTRLRLDHSGETGKKIVQIAGSDPETMANAARYNVDLGADVIDINMGCPAKKVCSVQAGSALLQNQQLVSKILEAVVNAVPIPVTLKIRTGTDPEHRNGLAIAKIAEQSGITSLAVHGRTRACAFRGHAEYHTIRTIKRAINIPVYANGDITSVEKARQVLEYTGADGIMIGRASLGNPWIFRQIKAYLETGAKPDQPAIDEIQMTMLSHLHALYKFYGEYRGIRIARKHIRWYLERLPAADLIWKQINQLNNIELQLTMLKQYFQTIATDILAA